MNSEIRNCQNCKNDFTIESEDFSFYEKIKVPPPTFCPECRLVRRLMWRNERNLYRRNCITEDGEKLLLSNYHPEITTPVYEEKYWWGDKWDPMEYGQSYDFSRPFFEQLNELIKTVPVPHATNVQINNSDYCNFTYQSKNCYLAFASDMNEDCAYLHRTLKSKNSINLEGCENMEACVNSYRSTGCYESSNVYFSFNCIKSHLMWDCHNCHDCYGCVGLRNKSNCIFNVQYSKEEYKEKIKSYLDGSYATQEKNLTKFFQMTIKYPRKFADILLSQNVSGDYIHHAKNCHFCFDVANKVEDCKYCAYAFSNMSSCYDVYAGGVNYEMSYETTASGENAQRLFMCAMTWTSTDMYYSLFCNKSSNCFGCVSLSNKKYCILNKQYTKEEYEHLVPKIIDHMNNMPFFDVVGNEYRFGEFFPSELSPFSYNETPAEEFFPLEKNVVLKKGYKWRDKEKNNYPITIMSSNLPDNINDVPDTIVNEVIECIDSSKDYSPGAFRIIPVELSLYRRLKLPIPRKSPAVRYFDLLKYNNPHNLWHRSCMCEEGSHGHDGKCQIEFETSYAPERPEIIYCESCYQKEVI